MWRRGSYDLLLTDLHMPGMNGFELAAALRKEERPTKQRTTIIAVTANAVHGEAEKCLDAGMDGYLTKPLGMKELCAALDRWRGESERVSENGANPLPVDSRGRMPAAASADEAAAGAVETGAIDERTLKELFGDDPQTFREILYEFLEPARANIEQIRAGFEDRVASEVQAGAHKLKSSARSVGAHPLADAAVVLEQAGKTGDWAVIEEKSAALPEIMDRIEAFVRAL